VACVVVGVVVVVFACFLLYNIGTVKQAESAEKTIKAMKKMTIGLFIFNFCRHQLSRPVFIHQENKQTIDKRSDQLNRVTVTTVSDCDLLNMLFDSAIFIEKDNRGFHGRA
jgi:hypothetical protein